MRILMLAAAAAMLGGCAVTEANVAIPYHADAAAAIGHGESVALTTTDNRTSNRERISTKINGYGMEMAAIRAGRPVPDIVQDALASEFQARGFLLGRAGCPVTVAVDRFYAQYHSGVFAGEVDGDVGLTVTVANAQGDRVFSGSVAGASKDQIELANGSNAAAALAAALQDAVHKLFADPAFVQAVLSQAPAHTAELGKPRS